MKKLSLLNALSAGCILLAFASTPVKAEPVVTPSAKVYHTVIFWLKPDTPPVSVNEIARSVKSMEKLPMVEQVLVGTPIMSDRDVVDDSFSIAFTMIFNDEEALSAYNADPYHKKISSEVTLPYVVRGLIYDYKTR
jgi:hypothetical protein